MEGDDKYIFADAGRMQTLVNEIRNNYTKLQEEFADTQRQIVQALGDDHVQVCRKDMQKVSREVKMMKGMLTKIIQEDVMTAYSHLTDSQTEVSTVRKQLTCAETDRDHWKARCEAILADIDGERKEKFELQGKARELSEQLNEQSEFCASMGAASCTLLWRVSRCEDSIQSLLVGSKVDDFLSMVASTLDSYMNVFKEDLPEENSEETQFVLALCGTITNIAASPFGRDFLMTNEQGKRLVDTFVCLLGQVPCRKAAKMKNLLLMSLYNLSINQRGLKYISSKSGLLSLLAWLVQEETDTESRLHSLRLIQSLLFEQQSQQLLHEAKEVLKPSLLQELACDPCSDIKETAAELLLEMNVINSEQ